ncbi:MULTISPECIES: bifunctional DNA-formamidopyrimidine glycosylase/DNA-(apurinic or apyrimidinic site) lyase [Microvirgula]|uniref:Formamidopyrimidine-DNA glycosylase n=1 Tax=Microvirgula aerodenitrificans TaxID=57480 RepID=A0A2S0PFB6_9NEIS|nr:MULTISPECIES: bifunctional DNA-formamidopyrimidine glycosylase/DNA-(apurinic or apyrimidinic site) lyase [Microvirgula]AVY96035.1 bifunctional DNA-formamidopyrimidine glycosylase/DNA-(apurinic or apyrimidinic site) lyase [Microvirgula aerodenitrificans]RAS15561.1 DNA-(apurinic or apyrimidinic site) lyase [Microvirgula sp. AG722]
MPELPEVETVRAGLTPHITGRTVTDVTIRDPRLRWPIDPALPAHLTGLTVRSVSRRAKYLLIDFGQECRLIMHLGMSGSIRMVETGLAPEKHDHLDLVFGASTLRFRDPRRFGAVLWHIGPPELHPLLARLGPEPLSEEFDGARLYAATRSKRAAIKTVLMDNHVVVGVGNIYANEALFAARIDPRRAANSLDADACARLVAEVREVLTRAIAAGGSTLRDFTDAIGKPGYFQQTYAVYGRDGWPCPVCGGPVASVRIGQRSSFYCPHCQC